MTYTKKATALRNIKAGKRFGHPFFDLWRDDKEVVMAAVTQCYLAFRECSLNMRGDKEVLIAAAKQSYSALTFAKAEARDNKDIMLAVVRAEGRTLHYASARLQDDEELVLAALTQSGDAFAFASPAIQAAIKKLDPQLTNPAATLQQILIAETETPNIAPRPAKNRGGIL